MTVGELIRFYREMRGMSQQELAKAANLPRAKSWSSIARRESGAVPIKRSEYRLFASALDIPISEFEKIDPEYAKYRRLGHSELVGNNAD